MTCIYFIIYVQLLIICILIVFADDTNIIFKYTNINNLNSLVTNELKLIFIVKLFIIIHFFNFISTLVTNEL